MTDVQVTSRPAPPHCLHARVLQGSIPPGCDQTPPGCDPAHHPWICSVLLLPLRLFHTLHPCGSADLQSPVLLSHSSLSFLLVQAASFPEQPLLFQLCKACKTTNLQLS